MFAHERAFTSDRQLLFDAFLLLVKMIVNAFERAKLLQ
jgi:hypothetical protein